MLYKEVFPHHNPYGLSASFFVRLQLIFGRLPLEIDLDLSFNLINDFKQKKPPVKQLLKKGHKALSQKEALSHHDPFWMSSGLSEGIK